eukprot:gene9268-biopygen15237
MVKHSTTAHSVVGCAPPPGHEIARQRMVTPKTGRTMELLSRAGARAGLPVPNRQDGPRARRGGGRGGAGPTPARHHHPNSITPTARPRAPARPADPVTSTTASAQRLPGVSCLCFIPPLCRPRRRYPPRRPLSRPRLRYLPPPP